jgi:hypothetical protein
VAWLQTIFGPGGHVYYDFLHDSEIKHKDKSNYAPLYASPPKREWVDLSREEMFELFEKYDGRPFSLMLATHDKAKEKNT